MAQVRTYLTYITLSREDGEEPLPNLEEAEELFVDQLTHEELDDNGLFVGAVHVGHAVGEPDLGNRSLYVSTQEEKANG